MKLNYCVYLSDRKASTNATEIMNVFISWKKIMKTSPPTMHIAHSGARKNAKKIRKFNHRRRCCN